MDLRSRLATLSPADRARLESMVTKRRPRDNESGIIRTNSASGPLSWAQQGMWLNQELDPTTAAYHLALPTRLAGAVATAALESAFRVLLSRHDALRTAVVNDEDGPRQRIHASVDFHLPVVDLTDADDPAGRITELATAQTDPPFDLSRPPLLRAMLVRTAAAEGLLLLTVHHLVLDGSSVAILLGELLAAYEANRRGEPPDLPALPVRHLDFATWQRAAKPGDRNGYAAQLDYWGAALDGYDGVLNLPTDLPRPARFSFRGARHPLSVPVPLARRLRAVAARHDATLFQVLLTTLGVLLHRYCGQPDIVIGAPVDGRRHAELENVLGLFVNTVPLRIQLADDPDFTTLLARVQRTCLDAFAHDEVPFELIVRDLGLARDTSRPALVQTMFSFQDNAALSYRSASVEARLIDLDTRTTKNELTFCLLADGDELAGYLEYNVDLFRSGTITALVEHWQVLLAAVTAELAERRAGVAALPVWTPHTLAQVGRDAAGPAHEAPPELVHEAFLRRAEEHPEATAVVAGGAHLSYGELARRALRLASTLRASGVGPEVAVGIALGDSVDTIVALLGTLLSGGAYVPLNLDQPTARLAGIVRTAGVSVLVDGRAAAARAEPLPTEITTLARLVREDGAAPVTGPPATPHRANLAYVLFTSGSTGQPKGVAVEHRQLGGYVRAIVERMGVAAAASYALVLPLSVDSAVTVLWPALTTGGTLYVLPTDEVADPHAMGAFFRAHRIDVLKIAPSHLRALPELPAPRLVVVGGEASELDWLLRYRAANPGSRILNHYGPTETTVGVLTYEVTGADDRGAGPTPLGRPLRGVRTYVLDRHLRPAPYGAVGEIYVGGEPVTRGYLGRRDLTAAVYLPDPHAAAPGQRMYRTGDLGRRRADGTVEYLGRIDAQVKIRGFRIEPAEVERALSTVPGVHLAAVAARELAPGNDALVAYVVPADGRRLTLDLVRDRLRTELPDYLLPAALVLLDELPRGSNGKVLRAALPTPGPAEQKPATRTGKAGDQVEDLMSRLWAEILGRESVPVDADFFAMGGHSLLGTQLVARIGKAFDVRLPLRAVFEQPTVRQLCRHLRTVATDGAPDEEIRPADRTGPLPLAPAQQRMWFLTELDPDVPVYNVPTGLRVTGNLDVAALEHALTRIMARHEILRTVFPADGGKPMQRVLAPEPVTVAVVDLRELAATEREAAAGEWLARESRRPFELARGPLLRVAVLRLTGNESVLMINLHHIAFDRWSRENFEAELSTLYLSYQDGSAAELPELSVQYGDFARWQRDWLAGGTARQQLTYWCEHLRDVPQLDLCDARPRPAKRDYRGDYVVFDLPKDTWAAVVALAAKEAATPFMVLVAVYQVLLHDRSGQTDFAVGTPIGNRTRTELEPLIGFFANTLVLRADLAGDPSYLDVLRRVRRTALDAYSHQDVPFDQVVEALAPRRSPNRDPVFDVMFTFQNVPRTGGLAVPGLEFAPLPLEEWIAKRDLTLRMDEAGGTVTGVLEYNLSLFDRRVAERFATDFVALVSRLCAAPETPIRAVRAAKLTKGGGSVNSPAKATDGRDRFRKVLARKPAKVTTGGTAVHTGFLPESPDALPVVLEAREPGLDLAGWAAEQRETIRAHLDQHGGVLCRGFRVDAVEDFQRFTAGQIDDLLDYQERSTPRQTVAGNVFTSTEYPADQHIELHNELSYSHQWPLKIAFYCAQAAATGGATTISDSRKILRLLEPDIRDRFAEHGVMYVRNFGGGVDLPWQEAFQTTERAEVEQYCQSAGISYEWRGEDQLRTRQVRAAVVAHPRTGEEIWFNSAHMFHVSALDDAVRESLQGLLAEDELPRHAHYGDGTPIPAEAIAHIRATYRDAGLNFPWRTGDVLLLDNMLACHGRQPFTGKRKVLVAFGELTGGTGQSPATEGKE